MDLLDTLVLAPAVGAAISGMVAVIVSVLRNREQPLDGALSARQKELLESVVKELASFMGVGPVGSKAPVARSQPKDDIDAVIERLRASAQEAVTATGAIARGLRDRSKALKDAQEQLAALQEREQQQQERLEALESVQPPAMAAFTDVLSAQLAKSNRIALKFFLLGVACSFVVTMIGVWVTYMVTSH